MRQPVDLAHANRLINHGPTVLVSSAHEGRRNVMAAAWSMPVEFTPPRVAVVIDGGLLTLPEGSRRAATGRTARRARGRVAGPHNERATTLCALWLPGPSGDLTKQPPAALQILAIAAAMAVVCALLVAVW